MLGPLAPPATPLGVGCCPIETFDFLNFLGTFGNSLVKIRPFGLLACWPVGLLASRPKGLIFTRELPKVPRKCQKIEGFYGAATHPPWGGLLPHRNPRFFGIFLGTFGNSPVKIRPFGLLACWPVGLLACWPKGLIFTG